MSKNLQGSSGNNEIQTPQELFDALDWQFDFDYDPFANQQNFLCSTYSTINGTYYFDTFGLTSKVSDADGLTHSWLDHRVFMNPPYGRALINRCIDKAIAERNEAALIVALVKADPSTKWFQHLMAHAHIEWLPKRVHYTHPNPPPGWSGASFPSAIAILRKDYPI